MRAIPLLAASAVLASAAVEFNRDVRPILADKCLTCHGTDAVNKRIPLRLDSEAAAKADLGSGRRAIVPHQPAQSELIRRVTAPDRARRMPPAATGHTLSEAEVETLRTWIEEGAKWEKHWSFIPPRRTATPPGIHPIDHLVRQRLDREGLRPQAPASRETLIRRASLDITGLPPSPAEIAAFLADRSPKAYERLLDRLLASPRYGERMAARWLDAARYADTNGYQFDGERVMWRWRDWVIDAFNANQRFDQFVTEQIAGDLLPGATLNQRIATGFNRNHRANTEDGIIADEYAVEYVVDRVETASTVFLGLTLGCARCHNHKYDPVTQKEFYQFFAFFNNVPELGRAMKYGNSPPVVAAPTREQQAQLKSLNAKIAAEERAVQGYETEYRAWDASAPQARWTPATGLHKAFAPGEKEAAGGFDNDDRFSFSIWFRADAVPDGPLFTRMTNSEHGRGYGLYARNGRFHAHVTSDYEDDAIRIDYAEPLEAGRLHHAVFTYDGMRMASGLKLYLNGREINPNVTKDTLYRPFRNAGRAFTEPFRVGAGNGKNSSFNGGVEDARVWSRVLAAQEIVAMSNPTSSNARRWQYLDQFASPAVRTAWKRLAELRFERERLEHSFPTVMVMAESPTPKQTHLLIRGAYDKKGEVVTAGVPAVLPALPDGAPPNRLGLARWMVSPENPLLARVTVNRVWQMLFGAGLVRTAEDFGLQGEWPSHPELLDWLATELVRSGWDLKHTVKQIMMSRTYQQSSRAPEELVQRDPDNRLLARGPRVRLAAEMLRDQALAVSGLLHEKLGGPSVKPYQPAGLWKDLIMQDMEYVQSQGPDLYRRGLYTFWKRTVAPPMMLNFDAANREACVVRESRTNTPLQALNLMNDVTFVEAARFTAQRMILEGGADRASRLRHGFLRVLGRAPTASEFAVVEGSLAYHFDYFASEDAARRYLSAGDTRPDPRIAPRELAAYAAVASLLMNLDEAVTKE
ncbi:MAG: DUF1553 domain-containing protein [Acidobacteria bacterium]|nr:DUF1553 domain-containing protein [Acidobacteriota bacterium]